MSVAALRPASGPVLPRLALALAAVAVVGGIVGLILAGLSAAAPPSPPPARNPFGAGLREAAPAASGGLGAMLLAWQASFHLELRAALASVKEGGAGWAALLGASFAYGVFHAAGPGHGKAIISAYVVASERALGRGLLLAVAAALVQAAVAIGLVLAVFALVGGTASTMASTTRAVEIAGFGLVALLGAALVWRKAGALAALASGAQRSSSLDPSCACHPDLAEAERAGWPRLAAAALGAGIRPCAGALVVLTLARAQGIFAAGIAATLAMAAGTALTTGVLAALSVYAKRIALRLAGGRGRTGAVLAGLAELAAAAFVLVIGLALLAGVWDGPGAT